MELEEAKGLREEVVRTIERFAVDSYGSKEKYWFIRGRAKQISDLPAVGISAGEKGYQIALRVYKEVDPELSRQIAKVADNRVDVRAIGIVQAQHLQRQRIRPLVAGLSVSHLKDTCGTIGCFVRKKGQPDLMILSNNHVLAHENDASIGDPIIQPGRTDQGRRGRDEIAALTEFITLQSRGNRVDAAVATVKVDPVSVSELPGIGALSGIYSGDIAPGLEVSKVGRTTGVTTGKVRAIEIVDLQAQYRSIKRGFEGVIEIEGDGVNPFSQHGDSGSLIVDQKGYAVALLFAGSKYGGTNKQGLSFAIPIRTVLDSLDVELALE